MWLSYASQSYIDHSPPPAFPSPHTHNLSSWVELERLHGDVTGRSQIIGGESADIVADMPNPRYLREKVGAALQGANGQAARGAFAASHLAIMGALTAATGALASSQREVQRCVKYWC